MPLPESRHPSREPTRCAERRTGSAARSIPGDRTQPAIPSPPSHRANQPGVTAVTATLLGQQKIARPDGRRPAPSRTVDARRARAPRRGRDEAVRRRPQAQAGGRDRGRLAPPRARRHRRDPRRQRLGQVDAHPARLGPADPRRGPGRGLRPRHRARGDGGQAADQPGERRRRLLQEAQPDGEPPLRGPALRPRREGGAGARRSRSSAGSASPRSGSAGRSSR